MPRLPAVRRPPAQPPAPLPAWKLPAIGPQDTRPMQDGPANPTEHCCRGSPLLLRLAAPCGHSDALHLMIWTSASTEHSADKTACVLATAGRIAVDDHMRVLVSPEVAAGTAEHPAAEQPALGPDSAAQAPPRTACPAARNVIAGVRLGNRNQIFVLACICCAEVTLEGHKPHSSIPRPSTIGVRYNRLHHRCRECSGQAFAARIGTSFQSRSQQWEHSCSMQDRRRQMHRQRLERIGRCISQCQFLSGVAGLQAAPALLEVQAVLQAVQHARITSSPIE